MGDPRRKNDDGFEQEALSVLQGGNDTGFDDEAAGVLAPKKESGGTAGGSFEPDPNLAPPSEPSLLEQFLNLFPKATADNPLGIDPRDAAAQEAQWNRMAQPGGIAREGINSLVQPAADAVMMSEGGPIAGAVKDVGGAAIKRGADAYTQSGGDILEALVAAKDAAMDPLNLALAGGGAALRGGSSLLQGGSNRARAAAFGATKDDLNALGVTPEEFAARTDELGLNNRFVPMDPADKRARIQEVLADRGAKHDAAIAAADAQNAPSPDSNPYRYHVTPADNVDAIRTQGLRPGSPKTFDYSPDDKLFFTNENGLGDWAGTISNQTKKPVVVLRTRAETGPMTRGIDEATRTAPVPPHDLEFSDPIAYDRHGRGLWDRFQMPETWQSGRPNYNEQIARDIDTNADRVWKGRSNQREGIVNAMGKTANAVEQGDPIDSLAELARYRTQQGGQAFGKFGTLPEAASGRGALAAYDSADQLLHEGMRASGDANYQLFTSADADFHDAKLLEELTNQAPPSNPWRRPIGAAVGAAVGMAAGGPIGAGIGAGVADLTRGYQPDMAANLMKLGASGADAMGQVAQRVGAPAAAEQLTQVQGQSRGQMQPQIVESLLDSNPQALGPYAQTLMQARKDGTLNQKLTQLRNTDDVWQRQFLPQLQQMSAQAQ